MLTRRGIIVLLAGLLLQSSAAAAGPPTVERGPYKVELWGKDKQQNGLLARQLRRVGGEHSLDRIGGTSAQQHHMPFLGKVNEAMRGRRLAAVKRVVIEPRQKGQAEVELKVKEHTLVVRPLIRGDKIKVISADRIEKLWDRGDAVGLRGWKLLFHKGRAARSKWQKYQPVSNLRVMLRDEVQSVAQDALAALKGASSKREGLRSVVDSFVSRQYSSSAGSSPLHRQILAQISTASDAELRAGDAAMRQFISSPSNRAGMSESVFSVVDKPMARSVQHQSALFAVSQVLNNHKIDVAALLNLANNRAEFVRYLPGMEPGANAKKAGKVDKVAPRDLKAAAVRLVDRLFTADRQTQRSLVAISQVLTRDDVRVRASIGVGTGLITAAAESALQAMKAARANPSGIIAR